MSAEWWVIGGGENGKNDWIEKDVMVWLRGVEIGQGMVCGGLRMGVQFKLGCGW